MSHVTRSLKHILPIGELPTFQGSCVCDHVWISGVLHSWIETTDFQGSGWWGVKYMLFVKRRMLSLYFSLMPIIFPKKGGRQCCLERIWICFSRQFWGSFRQFVGCWQMLVCWPLASWHILTGGHFVSRLSPIYFALPPNGWGHPHIGEKKYIWQVWFGKVWWKEMLVGSWKKFRWYSFVSMWSIMV